MTTEWVFSKRTVVSSRGQKAPAPPGRVVLLAPGVWVVGVGWAGDGSAGFAGPPLDTDLEEQCERLRDDIRRRLCDGDRVVVLSHYPPRFVGTFPGDNDPDVMTYESVAELVLALKPVVVVTGHMHEWAGLSATLRHENQEHGGRGSGQPSVFTPAVALANSPAMRIASSRAPASARNSARWQRRMCAFRRCRRAAWMSAASR